MHININFSHFFVFSARHQNQFLCSIFFVVFSCTTRRDAYERSLMFPLFFALGNGDERDIAAEDSEGGGG